MIGYELEDVKVEGGSLRVARRGHGQRGVLAIHGLAGSSVAMGAIGREFDEDRYTVVAPDLRGRGASCELPGPYGIDAHIRDCHAVLEAFGLSSVALTGHSMGGFIATGFAARHPERAERLVLVDGGLPLPIEIPEGMTANEVATVMLGPVVENLAQTYPSEQAYLDTWRTHPGLGGMWNDDLEARFRYEVTGEPPKIRARTSVGAVRADWADMLGAPAAAEEALLDASCPVTVFRAPRGILDQPTPTLSDDLIAEWTRRLPGLTVETIEGTNHLTIGILPVATKRIAAALRDPAA